MRRKRRFVLVTVIVITAAAVAAGALFFARYNHRYENDAMVVTWETGHVRPVIVEGIVLRQGRPVPGHDVRIETGSGAHDVTTGPDGRFSVDVGELEVVGLEVDGAGRIEWDLLFAPSTRKGLSFRIELK